MSKTKQTMAAIIALGCMICNTACVNQLADDPIEVEPSEQVPITFSVKIGKATTKVSNNLFEKGDKVGLYAMLTGDALDESRYIDNLSLTYSSNNALIPSKGIFYPEGDETTLDFISYYPYQQEGAASGSSSINISVQTDQSTSNGLSKSDFMVAKTGNVKSSNNSVALEYYHKLSKLKISLTPDAETDIEEMLADNPRIAITDCYTQASYDLSEESDNITIADNAPTADIIAGGEWEIKDGKLVGKEVILIPQTFTENQTIRIEWDGTTYTCQIPALGSDTSNKTAKSGTEYEIEITASKSDSYIFQGVTGSIKDWTTESAVNSSKSQDSYAAVHLSVFSYSKSNVYRVHYKGKVIAEICKEYLISDDLTSEAIVLYPVDANGDSDLTQGTVLQLASSTLNRGGTLAWSSETNSFSYTEGEYASDINKIYFNEDGALQLTSENAVEVNVLAYTIRDTRDGLVEYPIVKVGKQYWMRENLKATCYQDGTELTKQTDASVGIAGYFYNQTNDNYFYNGEAVINGELAPEGWTIPNTSDWASLNTYIGKDVSLIKSGTWTVSSTDSELSPVYNYTMLSILPTGIIEGSDLNYGKLAGFWTLGDAKKTIAKKCACFAGSSNEMLATESLADTETNIYKVLSIRCIKE